MSHQDSAHSVGQCRKLDRLRLTNESEEMSSNNIQVLGEGGDEEERIHDVYNYTRTAAITGV